MQLWVLVLSIIMIAALLAAIVGVNRPWFRAAAAVWVLQAIEGTLTSPHDAGWLIVWAYIEGVSLLLTIAAVLEAVYMEARPLELLTRFWIRFGSGLWSIGIYYWVWRPVHSTMANFLQARSMVGVWIVLTLLPIYAMGIYSGHKLSAYIKILFWFNVATILLRNVVVYTGTEWIYYNAAWRAALAIAAAGWALTYPGPALASGTPTAAPGRPLQHP